LHCYLDDLGIVCALGRGKHEVARALFAGDASGMVRTPRFGPECHLGVVDDPLPAIGERFAEYDCRTNRLLLAALEEIASPVAAAIERYGHARIGVALGTSTSGIAEGEAAIRQLRATGRHPDSYHFHQQQIGGGSDFLCAWLDITGPSLTISTACSSGAHALGAARRMLALGSCDAVIAGGADALCALTVRGFGALEAMSAGVANPFSRNRDGINIGEGAALMLIVREPGLVALLGVGNASDAHHVSAPHPQGRGARRAIEAALFQAGLEPDAIDYVNLHGTGTPLNDTMESHAVFDAFGATWCSSTKPLTGHTLGAAGAIEAAFCWLMLHPDTNSERWIAPHLWDGARDDALAPLALAQPGDVFAHPPRHALSNSFAFGGNNAAVVLGARA
jgi:3-oxoacyl-[acyl-carrier-protein] synthase-1